MGRERLETGGAPLRIEADGLDPRLRRVQPLGATAAQLVAALKQIDRFLKGGVPALEPGHDPLEFLEGVLER